MNPPSGPVSQLLVQWRRGDRDALQALVPLVYEELRRLARKRLQAERPGHTLQSTELVHEAYLRRRSATRICRQQIWLPVLNS